MVNPIPEFVKNVWSKWDIRCVVLTSLLLQITLIFLAPFRKRTRNSMVLVLLWFTYLFADYTANYGVGLISNKYGDEGTFNSNNGFLIAFWAPFLLLHLGGPDTITAFSLEDNELWLRHMLGLIVQVCLTAYVFLLTLPANTFWLPTTLIFLAGIIKFAERTRSLQLASIKNFQQSSLPNQSFEIFSENIKKFREKFPLVKDEELNTSSRTMPEQAHTTSIQMDKHKKEHLDDAGVVTLAFLLFNKFQGLIVDKLIEMNSGYLITDYFNQLTAIDALRVVEVELNFIYEAFYTKASLLHNKVSFFFRFLSVSSVVVAFVLFVFDQKHGCKELDVRVTYILLYGAVALDVASFFRLIFSDHTTASYNIKVLDRSYEKDNFKCIRKLCTFIFRCFLKLRRPKWYRRWSESISGFNFLSYCAHKKKGWVGRTIDCIGARWLEQWAHEEKNALCQELWIFIFKELQRKSQVARDDTTARSRILSSGGKWVIQNDEILQKDEKWIKFVDITSDPFERNMIRWHIATTLLFYEDEDVDIEQGSGNFDHENDEEAKLHRDFSKLLSDYMLYLLVMQPTIMSTFYDFEFEERWEGYYGFIDGHFDTRREKDKTNPSINRIYESTKKLFTRGNPSSEVAREKTNKKLKEACNKFYSIRPVFDIDNMNTSFITSPPFIFCHVYELTDLLKELKGTHKWKIIAQVWVEFLSNVATNCASLSHVQQLGKGGEFISLVWLLMTHLGFGKQFREI
ncbi:hypothetical protein VNO77_43033 [Canavalia gladiata]|uniref:DUF4220 domain-containing protein n=1 Tax=Canavalia gladiata TaxID=3824 RepID=A0AAN9PPP2_CANGL